MNKTENTQKTETAAETAATFETFEAANDELEVVEFENAPLTDINFGF